MERNVVDDNGNESAGGAVMAKGVAISYSDIAPEAKENFGIDVSEKKYDTIENLQKYNMKLCNYANPCEMYQTLLDGTAEAFPENAESANIGLWSKQLSNDDGTFTEPITVTLESEGQYSSQGFTFTFDKFNDIHPTKLTIQWFRVTNDGIEDLSGETEFIPTSGYYFCRNQVENFNKVVIKFYSLNMPRNRLKLEAIDYGYATIFYGEELRNVKISQSLDPISSELKINTCDFTLDSKTDMVYSFQAKQPLTINFNDKLIATAFVKTSKRKGKFAWEVSAEDYIGILDSIQFVGGMYSGVPASEIIEAIFKTAKVPYSIAEEFYNYPLTGYIGYTTCREALMQVCFACMAVVNTANADVVEIKSLEDDIKQIIPLNRIMQGQSFEESDTLTSIELTAHTYSLSDETIETYKAEESGSGNSILVKFSEPLHELTITNGEILSSSANYAIINANEQCVLQGKKYEHSQTVKTVFNPTVLASEKENVKSITNATLISVGNVDVIAAKCYNWLSKVNKTNAKIVIGKDVTNVKSPALYGNAKYGETVYGYVGNAVETVTDQEDVNLGDVIECETEYLGNVVGRITSSSFNLNGNIIVKECTIV